MFSSALELAVLAVLVVVTHGGHDVDVKCFSCANVQDPRDCLTEEYCNLDEVCFTREAEDHNGNKVFRLGCEHSDVCASLTSGSLCYQCCSSDTCNSQLCASTLGQQTNGTGTAVRGGFYMVTIFTGSWEDHDSDYLGTRADVGITLIGTAGTSGQIVLKNPHRSRFQQGGIDKVNVTTPASLGRLSQIRVELLGPGNDDMWFLKEIDVEDGGSHQTAKFLFYAYLDANSQGHQTVRTVCAE